MKCSQCKHDNPDGANFCEECASALQRMCANCGAQLRPNAKFCPQCAHPAERGNTQRAPAAASPTAYTPQYLADRILTSRSALEGERKQVTVLFADLTGSMELLADRDPEEARAVLDPVLGHMMEAVHAYDGTVNQVMGDGIMALFGAPLALEDHAVRACYAAKRMQERISRYGDEVQRQYGVPIQLRIGLHSGDVVVRSIGSDLKMDYSAIGQTTHLAARMEQTAKPGTILATADTVRLAEGFIQVSPLGPVAVKGMGEPVEVFELTGALMRRSRMQARAASGGLTRFVGRQREFEALAQAASNVKDGKGQVVATLGEPGVGKSRLFWEFTHSHHTHGCLVVEASSVSYGKATSFLPVIDLLKNYFQIGERDDARSVKEKVTGKLLTLDRSLDTFLPPLLALLDQPLEDAQWSQLEPPQRRRQTLEALKQLWLREAQNQPLVLVFEDLHWIDSETQELLNEFLEKVPTASILLLFNYRPEYQSPWGSKSFYTQLRLDALPVESAAELLTALLGPDRELVPLKDMLVRRGNPFFLEETVRTLIETGTLVGERGAYRLTQPVETLQIPATVQAILAARIDRLDAEDKYLLQTASVIGKDVPFELLKAITDISDTQINNALARLQAAEFVYEAGMYPDVEYTFKHALTHEVAYGGLTHERKQRLHAQIVNAIEQIYANRIDEYTERLAHHALRGEVWDKAVKYLRQAGQRAFARSANAEATRWWEQALEAAEHLPDSKHKTEQQIDIRLELRGPLIALAKMSRCIELIQAAQGLAEEAGDRLRIARALAHEVHVRYLTCEFDRALEAGTRAIEFAEKDNFTDVHVVASVFLPTIWRWRGRLDESENNYRIAMRTLETIPENERFGMTALPGVYIRGLYTTLLMWFGRFSEALDLVREADNIAREASHPYSAAFSAFCASAVLTVKGDFENAIKSGEHALSICEATEGTLFYPWVAAWLGFAYAHNGRTSTGIELISESAQRFKTMDSLLGITEANVLLPEAYYLNGAMETSLDAALKAIDTERITSVTLYRPMMLELIGRIHASPDHYEPDLSQKYYQEGLMSAMRQNNHVVIAHCHAGLGRLNRSMDKKAGAREELTRACEMYGDMGMTSYLRKAEQDLAAIG